MADPNPSEISPEERAIEGYIDKTATLALLLLGGLTREELRELPDVSDEDIAEAERRIQKLEGGT